MIQHDMQPGALADRRAEFEEASRPWHAFLRAHAGFRQFLVLGDAGADRMVAISLWESEADFQAVFANPAARAASAALMVMAAGPAPLETFEVLAREQR
jgi:heme-degrading monooxygenase HmoA